MANSNRRSVAAIAAKSNAAGPQLVTSAPAKSARPSAQPVSIDAGDHRERLRARRDELVNQYAGMVRPIAERVMLSLPSSFELDDLIQTGMIGLLTAATRYRPEEHGGVPFSAYARFHIRGAILDSISGRNWQFAKMTEPFCHQENRPDLVDDAVPTINEAIDAHRKLRQAEDAIAYLDVRSQHVLNAYFLEEKTLDAVGEEIGASRQSTGEYRAAAIMKVKRILHVVEK